MTAQQSDRMATRCAAVVADCACEGLRRAARAISRVYATALSAVGLTPTQLAILVATRQRGSVPLSRLARGLQLDRTSLYRAIRPLERDRLLDIGVGRTQRERVATVTATGERVLRQALPVWTETQARFVDVMGPRAWTAASSALAQLASAAEVLESRGGGRRRRSRRT
jgi:DNA-binding MarR family transcriptional regulator